MNMTKKKSRCTISSIVYPISMRDISRYNDYGFVQYKLNETFGEALRRYMSDTAINRDTLSKITDISLPAIHRYLHNEVEMSLEHTAAICIAMRLHPMRSEYLFDLSRSYLNKNDQRDSIILHFLYGCAFQGDFTLKARNLELKSRRLKPLTDLDEG